MTVDSSRSMRIDFHLHTWASFDCLSDPERVLEAATARGIDRIAITDHNEIDVALALAQRYPDRVIPGEEVKTAEGVDVIGLYLTERIPKGTPALDTCAAIRAQGGLVYLPHPYAPGKGGSGALVPALLPHLDVLEVHNGRLRPAVRNERAAATAAQAGLLRGAGSDAHTLREVARTFVELPRHVNHPEALRLALADAQIHGFTSSPLMHLASTWAKVRKRLPAGRQGGTA